MVATIEFQDVTMKTYCDQNFVSCISVAFTNPIIENIKTEASYDFQSLIGEIGGTLGLFLGLSGLGILQMLKLTKKWMVILMKIFTLMLLIAFIVYASQSLIKYVNESLATTVKFVRGNMTEEFPFLTFCPDLIAQEASESFHDLIKAEMTYPNIVVSECELQLSNMSNKYCKKHSNAMGNYFQVVQL